MLLLLVEVLYFANILMRTKWRSQVSTSPNVLVLCRDQCTGKQRAWSRSPVSPASRQRQLFPRGEQAGSSLQSAGVGTVCDCELSA